MSATVSNAGTIAVSSSPNDSTSFVNNLLASAIETWPVAWLTALREYLKRNRKPYSIWAAREALHCLIPPGPVTVSEVTQFMSDKFRELGVLARVQIAFEILNKFGEGWVYPTQFKGLSIHPLVRKEFHKLNPGVVFDSDRQQWRKRDASFGCGVNTDEFGLI